MNEQYYVYLKDNKEFDIKTSLYWAKSLFDCLEKWSENTCNNSYIKSIEVIEDEFTKNKHLIIKLIDPDIKIKIQRAI